MTTAMDVQILLRQRIHELAHEMVQLDGLTSVAHHERKWVWVGELNAQRDEVREHRSALMRELWESRRCGG